VGFRDLKEFRFIADIAIDDHRAADDDITTFLRPLIVHKCWRYQIFLSFKYGCVTQRYHSFYLIKDDHKI
jgi:hypothetical protein